MIRLRLQDVAEQLPGTVGFVIPDRFHLVYLEVGRAANALGLSSTSGSRIAMASTAAGHAYTAALDTEVGDALLAEMEREIPDGAKLLRPRLEANRRFLREHGYVVACGLWSPHINGLAVPLWSPQYQTYVVVTIGLLSAMYDEKRLHKEVAPRILELSAAIGGLLEGAEANCSAIARRASRFRYQTTIIRSSRRRIRMNWKPELDDLARREAFAREMGGVDKVKRQRDQGRLTVRERIDKLVDQKSFHEIGAISGTAEYDEHGELKNLTPANCVFGRGKIDGRTVVVVGDDFTVRGGSADASISAKPLMAEEMAHDFRLPIIRMIEGSGGGGSVKTIETKGAANLPGGVGGTRWYWYTTANMARVPVVGLGLGSVAGLGRGAACRQPLFGDDKGFRDVRRRSARCEAARPGSQQAGTRRRRYPDPRRRRRSTPSIPRRRRSSAPGVSSLICRRRSTSCRRRSLATTIRNARRNC